MSEATGNDAEAGAEAGAEDPAAQLQRAVLGMIGAARLALDAAERLVSDPGAVGAAAGQLADLARLGLGTLLGAASRVAGEAGGPTASGTAGETRGGGDHASSERAANDPGGASASRPGTPSSPTERADGTHATARGVQRIELS